jgi:hypothetical protein
MGTAADGTAMAGDRAFEMEMRIDLIYTGPQSPPDGLRNAVLRSVGDGWNRQSTVV